MEQNIRTDRFGGVGRLYGEEALDRFTNAHVAVIGIGGVGSWAVESLARSGIGHITKIDLDDVCVTNTNRQIHALNGNFGKQKTQAMAERVAAINPNCKVTKIDTFYRERNADELLSPGFDFVIDSIDQVFEKAHLIASCKKLGIPVISCGGTGGKTDPTQIKIADFIDVTNDPMINKVRTALRSKHGFPNGTDNRKNMEPFGVEVIYSTQNAVYPQCDGSVSPTIDTTGSEQPKGNMRLNCASGFGSITHMTATVGLFAAARALDSIAQKSLS